MTSTVNERSSRDMHHGEATYAILEKVSVKFSSIDYSVLFTFLLRKVWLLVESTPRGGREEI